MSHAIAVLLIFSVFFPLAYAQEKTEVPAAAKSRLDQDTLSEMERIRKEPRISSDFSRGEFLIYDCRNRNFACVNEPSYERCKKLREAGYKNKKMVLPCAPLKEFKDQPTCFKKHYSLIHRQKAKAFCQNIRNAKY